MVRLPFTRPSFSFKRINEISLPPPIHPPTHPPSLPSFLPSFLPPSSLHSPTLSPSLPPFRPCLTSYNILFMLFPTIPLVPPPLHPFSLYLWKATHSFVTPYSWSLSQGLSNYIFLSLVPGLQAVASGMWTCPCPESLACRAESTCGDNPGCTWATWTTSDRTRPHSFHPELGRNGPLHHKTKDNCQT